VLLAAPQFLNSGFYVKLKAAGGELPIPWVEPSKARKISTLPCCERDLSFRNFFLILEFFWHFTMLLKCFFCHIQIVLIVNVGAVLGFGAV
jgi:hypothetical protein